MEQETTKKVLKYAATGIVGALVGFGALAIPMDNHYQNQVAEMNNSLTSATHTLSSLNLDNVNLIAERDLLKAELVNLSAVEPIVCPVADYSDWVKASELAMMLDFVQDNVDEDVDIDYILFETDARIEAEAWINNELVNYLDDEDYFDNGELLDNYRTSEVSIKKIYDAEVVDRDFEDKDATLQYEVTIKAKESGEDREYFSLLVTMPFEDNSFVEDDVQVEIIEE